MQTEEQIIEDTNQLLSDICNHDIKHMKKTTPQIKEKTTEKK